MKASTLSYALGVLSHALLMHLNHLKPKCQTKNCQAVISSFTAKLPYGQLVLQSKFLQQKCSWSSENTEVCLVFSDILFVKFSPIPYQTYYLQIFSLILWVPFSLCYYRLIHKSFEVLMQSHLCVFASVAYAFEVISKMSVPNPVS